MRDYKKKKKKSLSLSSVTTTTTKQKKIPPPLSQETSDNKIDSLINNKNLDDTILEETLFNEGKKILEKLMSCLQVNFDKNLVTINGKEFLNLNEKKKKNKHQKNCGTKGEEDDFKIVNFLIQSSSTKKLIRKSSSNNHKGPSKIKYLKSNTVIETNTSTNFQKDHLLTKIKLTKPKIIKQKSKSIGTTSLMPTNITKNIGNYPKTPNNTKNSKNKKDSPFIITKQEKVKKKSQKEIYDILYRHYMIDH